MEGLRKMIIDELKNYILETIKTHSNVSFADLVKHKSYSRGKNSVQLDGKNIVLWTDMSDDVMDTINDLINSDIIKYEPCSEFPYVLHGIKLDMPIAKKAVIYQQPKWLPVQMVKGENFDNLGIIDAR